MAAQPINASTMGEPLGTPWSLELVKRRLGPHPKKRLTLEPASTQTDLINGAVGQYQSGIEWRHGKHDLQELSQRIRTWIPVLWSSFLPTTWKDAPVSPPTVLITFERASSQTLGFFRPGRNSAGLRWQISLNPVHLDSLAEIGIAAIILHELLHVFEACTAAESDCGRPRGRSRQGYHSAWLQRTARSIGIPCTQWGRTEGITPGSRFVRWAREAGLSGEATTSLTRVRHEQSPDTRRRQKAVLHHSIWKCSCGLVPVKVAVDSTLEATCTRCNSRYQIEATAAGRAQ